MAVVIITGGGGFLGQCLASSLINSSKIKTSNSEEIITKVVLADIFFSPSLQLSSPIITRLVGDISSPKFCESIFSETKGASHVSIFHLGAVMSGDGEKDFDLCLKVNLHGTLLLLERARRLSICNGNLPKFIFVSSGFTIGSGAPTDYIGSDDIISDSSRATPHNTYGATKACGELMMSDYSRKGFIDGRGVRLPTVAVRAGKPNSATTGCFSAILREPLKGENTVMPIGADLLHALTSSRSAVGGIMAIHDAPLEMIEKELGFDRTVFLPAKAICLREFEEALNRVVVSTCLKNLGEIKYDVDDFLSEAVASFPTKINADRALKLGAPPAPDADTFIREYAADFPNDIHSDILLVPIDVD